MGHQYHHHQYHHEPPVFPSILHNPSSSYELDHHYYPNHHPNTSYDIDHLYYPSHHPNTSYELDHHFYPNPMHFHDDEEENPQAKDEHMSTLDVHTTSKGIVRGKVIRYPALRVDQPRNSRPQPVNPYRRPINRCDTC